MADKNGSSNLHFLAHGLFRGSRPILLLLFILSAWEAMVQAHWVDGRLFPAPSSILWAILDMAEMGILWSDVTASVLRVTVGFLSASTVAILLAAVFSRSEMLAVLCTPIIEVVRPISVIAWIPISVLWFGLGNRAAWFIICIGAFFPIFTNAFVGFKSVDLSHVQAAQCLGAGRVLFVKEVLWPSALPHILTGMRIGLGTGWTAVIAAELIAGQSGLGYMIQMARMMLETEKVIGGMIMIGVIGYGMNFVVMQLEKHLVPWRDDANHTSGLATVKSD
jgi:ABC-type nitrate/sulfonate/bicarbonate transport system permease component